MSPRGFVRFEEGNGSTQLPFRPNINGGALYFSRPDLTRVIDAVKYPKQVAGTSWGRSPDGSPGFLPLSTQTPASANAAPVVPDIVINEIMYNPITGDENDEFIELHNRSASSVSLAGWQIHGIGSGNGTFAISGSPSIAAGGYFVIGKDSSRLLANYANLNNNNSVGGYGGSLANSGERIILFNQNSNFVDEVTYSTGGRWGKWSDGGGSSLELISPNADNQLPSNWADSDESGKSVGTNVSFTGTVGVGDTSSPRDTLELGLLGPGACIVDDVVARVVGAANRITNPQFTTDLAAWGFEGSHAGSFRVTSGGTNNSAALRVEATGRVEYLNNRVTNRLSSAFVVGNNVQLSAWTRWLRGNPDVLLRLRGNGIEARGRLPLPGNLGSPGQQNSRFAANVGPAIIEVQPQPVLPAASQPVLITARVHDPNGVNAFSLKYRLDPASTYSSVTMLDNGTAGDAVAGDGVFTAKIPGQSADQIVAFYLEATDSAGTPLTSRFPASAPTNECLLRFGEAPLAQSFGAYRVWMTRHTLTNWAGRAKIDSTPLDITFVYGQHRVIYNGGGAFSGSDSNSDFYDSPTNILCGYDIDLPPDDRLLGASGLSLDLSAQDVTGQRESLSYWLADKVEIPFNHRRYVHLVVNGHRANQRPIRTDFGQGAVKIYMDIQEPGGDYLSQWYSPDAQNNDRNRGDLFKIQVWRTTYKHPLGMTFNTTNASLLNQLNGGIKNVPAYRWNWRQRAVTTNATDFQNLFTLVDAVNTTGAGYLGNVQGQMDVEQWGRVLGWERCVGNFDSYGWEHGQNMYTYLPSGTSARWHLLPYDSELGFGTFTGNGATNASLFTPNNDPVLSRLLSTNLFRRALWRGMHDVVNSDNGPMRNSQIRPRIEAARAALAANGYPTTPTALTNWSVGRREYVRTQLATVQPAFAFLTPNNTAISQTTIQLTGQAPIEVTRIHINNDLADVEWTSATQWRFTVGLPVTGNNPFIADGFNRNGNATHQATVNIIRNP